MTEAAGYLRCAPNAIYTWTKQGKLPCIEVPPSATTGKVRFGKQVVKRYLMKDLDAFALSHRIGHKMDVWTDMSEDLPVKLISQLLHLKPADVHDSKTKGILKDFTSEAVREHIRMQYKLELGTEIRTKYENRVRIQRRMIQRLITELKAVSPEAAAKYEGKRFLTLREDYGENEISRVPGA